MRSGLVLVVSNVFVATHFGRVANAAFTNHRNNVQRCTLTARLPERPTKTTRPRSPNVDTFLLLRMGWFDDLFRPLDAGSSAESEEERRRRYPEQYPATYDMLETALESDDSAAAYVRPLLKSTQLERRPLRLVYDASRDGWSPEAFHRSVDGRGAAVVVARAVDGRTVGGYNPKGWASTGGARPSVASFLFVRDDDDDDATRFRKLRKVGGGGLACAFDDPDQGIHFGPDGLVIPLREGPGGERSASSKLGPYYEREPDGTSSLFPPGAATELAELRVFVGVYKDGQEIPYSGAVLDMTSG